MALKQYLYRNRALEQFRHSWVRWRCSSFRDWNMSKSSVANDRGGTRSLKQWMSSWAGVECTHPSKSPQNSNHRKAEV